MGEEGGQQEDIGGRMPGTEVIRSDWHGTTEAAGRGIAPCGNVNYAL